MRVTYINVSSTRQAAKVGRQRKLSEGFIGKKE